ncbi:MAG TPA: hypothetical protein VFN97_26475 [Actinospica sp.]|nr:hypothetical protein [Actinospica sp.]
MQRRMLPCILAALGLTVGLTTNAAAASSNYYYKYFATSGSISTWYSNDSSWGVNAPNGTGFVAMVDGEDWGTWSPGTDLPKKLNTISSNNTTWFSQNASPASGAGYDATYDIFIDPTYAPTNRNSLYEIMIWAGYHAPNQPLSDSYNASGQAVPYATGVNLDGRTFNVYLYHWSGGGLTMTYADAANPGWFSGSLTPFFNYGEGQGWYNSNDYLTSVMAGWEFGHGSYTATSWGVAGL